MSERELNKCQKCNTLHEGNGDYCGICQDSTIEEIKTLKERIETLEGLLVHYRADFKASFDRVKELRAYIKKYKQDVRAFFNKVKYIERDDA